MRPLRRASACQMSLAGHQLRVASRAEMPDVGSGRIARACPINGIAHFDQEALAYGVDAEAEPITGVEVEQIAKGREIPRSRSATTGPP
jgi:hypothetical protein